MNFFVEPWQLLLVALFSWGSQRQHQNIELQNSQIQALLKKLVLLSDGNRRR